MDPSRANDSTPSNRRAELVGRRTERELGIDPDVASDVDDGEQQITEFVGDLPVVPAVDRFGELRGLLGTFGSAPDTSGQSKPTFAALRPTLCGVAERRERARDSVEDRRPSLLGVLDLVPVRPDGVDGVAVVVDDASPNTCGCRRTSLSWMPAATSAIVNRPSCSAIDGMEFDLVEQVAEFLDEVVVGVARVGSGPTRLQRVDDLVGLLDQVAG